MPDQFQEYMARYQNLVFSVCLSFVKNYFDAEDLAQETFCAAYRRFDSFDGQNFKAWITTIAANKCRDYLRSPVKSNKNIVDFEMELLEDPRHAPEDAVIQSVEESAVRAVCMQLKEPYRTVALQYFCEDVKLSTLSKATGKNLKTLQTQLYRAKKLLAALWKEESA